MHCLLGSRKRCPRNASPRQTIGSSAKKPKTSTGRTARKFPRDSSRMSQMVEFSRPDVQTAPGYLAEPPAPVSGTPGIVLVEEWWGLDDRIKQTADRLAGEGFAVLVPDLFRGRTAAVGDEANHLLEGLDFEDAATQDLA